MLSSLFALAELISSKRSQFCTYLLTLAL